MSKNVVLTYAYLRSLKPAVPGTRYFIDDALVPGLKVMVTDRRHLSYGMKRRWPGRAQPSWRRIADVYVAPKAKSDNDIDAKAEQHGAGVLTILEARNVARAWLDQVGRKVDPRAAEIAHKAQEKLVAEAAAAAAEREKATRFSAVARAFQERHVSTLAKSAEVSKMVSLFVDAWGDRPATDVTPLDVLAVIKPIVDRGTRYQALNTFRIGSRLYGWAAGSPEFATRGHNPFKGLSPKTVIGDTPARSRRLKDQELRAIWRAAGEIGGPPGDVVRLLLLTAKRLKEIARLSWQEIDLDKAEAIIPAVRMKGRDAPDHLLPLAPEALKILRGVSHGTDGDFVFTSTDGEKPISLGDKTKKQIDKRSGVTGWVLHDLRRAARTHLSACPVEEHVREAILAHVRKGITKTYDLYDYQDEKRVGLEFLERRLMAIVEPPPTAAVTHLSEARARRGMA